VLPRLVNAQQVKAYWHRLKMIYVRGVLPHPKL
jgi:hypothetical protein